MRNLLRPDALRLLLGLWLSTVIFVACSDDTDDSDQNEDANGSAQGASESDVSAGFDGSDVELVASYQPVYEEGSCPFVTPSDTSPLCGTLTVPADWTDPEGSAIELAFAVFAGPTEAEGGAVDPVVYLEGGPGSHTLETLPFSFDLLFRPLTEQRDVILFDQRGVGESKPRLDCVETTEVDLFLADNPDTTDDESLALVLESVASCRDRLSSEGVNFADYDTVQNARDVEALRLALGYDQWNLYGISYGTRLGLEVLGRFPDSVRSAVLDSVYPPNAESIAENPSTFVDSFEKVAQACRAETACAAPGDFAERVQRLVGELEANPLPATVSNWLTGEVDDVLVDGDALQGVVSQALYTPSSFTDLPEVMTDLENGEVSSVEVFLSQSRTNDAFFSTGMFFALTCRDEVAFADPDEVNAALPESPFEPGQPFDVAINVGPAAFELCSTLDVGAAQGFGNEAVTSDVPTLLLAGRFDPVTPVSWAELALETLSSGYIVVAENGSHAVSADACGVAITAAFLADPTQAPDASCFDDDELQFLGSDSDPIELETVSLDDVGGAQITVVRPVGWEDGGFDSYQYRGESILDSTELFQLAGDPGYIGAIREVVQSDSGVTLGSAAPFSPSDRLGSLDGGDLGFAWTRRSGTSDGIVVEWFERSSDDVSVAVALVAPADESERLIEQVLIPALQGFVLESS